VTKMLGSRVRGPSGLRASTMGLSRSEQVLLDHTGVLPLSGVFLFVVVELSGRGVRWTVGFFSACNYEGYKPGRW